MQKVNTRVGYVPSRIPFPLLSRSLSGTRQLRSPSGGFNEQFTVRLAPPLRLFFHDSSRSVPSLMIIPLSKTAGYIPRGTAANEFAIRGTIPPYVIFPIPLCLSLLLSGNFPGYVDGAIVADRLARRVTSAACTEARVIPRSSVRSLRASRERTNPLRKSLLSQISMRSPLDDVTLTLRTLLVTLIAILISDHFTDSSTITVTRAATDRARWQTSLFSVVCPDRRV